MKNIVGIPSTRVSDLWARQRVLQQIQHHQKELLRLEYQLSTGYRFELPGEEPVTALRVIGLQRLLERKEQVRANLSATQSYLSAADAAMSGISGMVAEVRAVALGSIDTVVTDTQRAAAVVQIDQAIEQLMAAGNQKFRDRYLFAGSTTYVLPFQQGPGNSVQYHGNEEDLLSYCDIELLSPSNVTGSEVFGAISGPVRGSVDLSPVLTDNTRLADLRGGEGIRLGSIVISDGTDTSIVDLSTAETVGDVAALIRANPPGTRTLDVVITATGLNIQLDLAPGDLSIREVGGGTTAYELGILTQTGVGNNWIVGSDLDPILRLTTRLADIPGIQPFDQNSGLQIVNGGATYIIDLSTAETIEDLLNLLNGAGAGLLAEINEEATGIDVRSRLSGVDFAIGENGGDTATQLGLRTFTTETKLEDLNFGRGVHTEDGVDFSIQLTNGTVLDIDLTTEETIGDVLTLINTVADGWLQAQLSQYGNGIELIDQTPGAQPLSVTRAPLSTAAIDLGLIPEGQDSATAPSGQPNTLTGADVHPLETEGLFTALLRLKQGLEADDLRTIQRAVELLDAHVLRMNLARAEVGARQQGLDVLGLRLDTEEIQLREVLSLEHEADLAEVISDLSTRQTAFQATLMSAANIFEMTLWDYL